MKQKILLSLGIIFLISALCVFNAKVINPKQLTVRQEIITSEKIDSNFNDCIIAYFADLEFSNSEMLDKLVKTINDYDPDIVIFGGDLLSSSLTGTQTEYLVTSLKSIDANYGKYYVHGIHDSYSTIDEIMSASDFRLLENETTSIYHKTSHINLVGLNPLASDSFTTDNSYTFVICHTPDTFDLVINNNFDYFLAGQSHGGQVYLPFISLFNREQGCQNYYVGKYKKNNKVLDITNGIGTTGDNARFLSDPEVVIYKLQSLD